jgi:hypothetical protein
LGIFQQANPKSAIPHIIDKSFNQRYSIVPQTYLKHLDDASDIRLSTLMRIVRDGFGKHLKLSVGT